MTAGNKGIREDYWTLWLGAHDDDGGMVISVSVNRTLQAVLDTFGTPGTDALLHKAGLVYVIQ